MAYRDLGDRGGKVEALNQGATLRRVSGDLVQAEGCHQQALDLARAIGSSWDEAHALAGLGRCAVAAGAAAEAEDRLRQALEIFQRIGAAAAGEVSAELQVLTDACPAAPRSWLSAKAQPRRLWAAVKEASVHNWMIRSQSRT